MFERDHYGQNPDLPICRRSETAELTRLDLHRQRYLEEKRVRLNAEAKERRLRQNEGQSRGTAGLLSHVGNSVVNTIERLVTRRRAREG